jgi:citrate lyase subunit beta/citryl-CoA lyase
MLAKARVLPCDAVMLDLEDGVPPGEKQAARAILRQALDEALYGPLAVVRVNAFATGLAEDDLRATLTGGVAAVCLPKAETPADVLRLATLIAGTEAEQGWTAGKLGILLMVETALGVLNAHAMACASPRVQALCLGGEDLTRDLGATRTRQGSELAFSRAHLVVAARAARIRAIDTIWTGLDDPEGLEAESRQARQLGYSGKLVIHPSQIAPVHRAFAPTEAEILDARRVVEAAAAGQARGDGVVALSGQMIDAPVVARAREVLRLSSLGS